MCQVVRNMSDIYLELKARIPVVAAKTHVGTARLQEAQDRTGLSNESIAREIPVSEKTWRRWKEAGTIPTAALPAVARVLRLDLVAAGARGRLEATPAVGEPPTLGEPVTREELQALSASIAEIRASQARTERMLQRLAARPRRAGPASG